MRLLLLPLTILAGCQAEQQRFDTKTFDAAQGGDFRFVARSFLFELNPSCELTQHSESKRKLANFENEWATLRSNSAGKPIAIEFAISEADSEFEISQRGVPDCPLPDLDGKDAQLAERLWKLDLLLTTLKKIIVIYPPKLLPTGN